MRRESQVWLAAALLFFLLWCGCSGILMETNKDGQTERLRLDATSRWNSYDRNSTKQDESLIMLKKESTF